MFGVRTVGMSFKKSCAPYFACELVVYAETASNPSPAINGNQDTVSMTFAAAIWDAEVPCCVKTA